MLARAMMRTCGTALTVTLKENSLGLALSANTTRSAPRKGTGRRTANEAGRSMVTAAAPRLKAMVVEGSDSPPPAAGAGAPPVAGVVPGERRGPGATGPGRGRALAPKLGVRQGLPPTSAAVLTPG